MHSVYVSAICEGERAHFAEFVLYIYRRGGVIKNLYFTDWETD